MSFLRFLMILSLVVWVGGISFLSFVEAPTAFRVAPTRHMAGSIVGPSLSLLHWMGLFSGVIFLGSSMLLSSLSTGSARPFAARNLFVFLMLLLTVVSQFVISPKMAALRTSFQDIDQVSPENPARVGFQALHRWSERLEGGVLLLGIVAIFALARTLK